MKKYKDWGEICDVCEQVHTPLQGCEYPPVPPIKLASNTMTNKDTREENWEEEFDKIWNTKTLDELNGGQKLAVPDFDAIKSFINSLLQRDEQRLIEEVEKMRLKEPEGEAIGMTAIVRASKIIGHNEALDNILSLLKQDK